MKTKAVQKSEARPSAIDRADRIILRLLAENADRSYAELGEHVHLSTPAVFERVKRLRKDGFIKSTIAQLDGDKVGSPLLAFIHIGTTGWGVTDAILALRDLVDLEEMHTTTGDVSLILKVRCSGPAGLERLLAQIQEIDGVRSTHSFIVLGTYLERGPRPREMEKV